MCPRNLPPPGHRPIEDVRGGRSYPFSQEGTKEMKCLATGLLALTLLCGAGRARADYLVNGGFETGNFSGWTQSGNTGFTFVSSSNAYSGTYAAWLGPVGSLGHLSQTVATTPGASYDLNFFLSSHNSGPNQFQVLFGGTTVFNQVNMADQGYT